MTATSQGFTISGAKLLDANGNEFIIRGINNPHIWYQKESLKALDQMVQYKVNCIRIVWNTSGTAKELEKVIKSCIDLQMVPMVELHNATGDTTIKKLMELANYYCLPEVKEVILKYEKYTLINIANEWGAYFTTSVQWKEAYLSAIDALRKAGYKTTLVIDAPNWGQRLEPILEYGDDLLKNDPLHNLLFSIHMYGFWNDPEKIDSGLQKVHDLSLPLIVGEFGYNYDNGNNNLTCKADHIMILRKCIELNFGYLPWSWTGNDEVNAWLDMTKPGDWETLTWWGKEVLEGKYGISKTAKKASIFNTP